MSPQTPQIQTNVNQSLRTAGIKPRITEQTWNNIMISLLSGMSLLTATMVLGQEVKQVYTGNDSMDEVLLGWRRGRRKDIVYVKGSKRVHKRRKLSSFRNAPRVSYLAYSMQLPTTQHLLLGSVMMAKWSRFKTLDNFPSVVVTSIYNRLQTKQHMTR